MRKFLTEIDNSEKKRILELYKKPSLNDEDIKIINDLQNKITEEFGVGVICQFGKILPYSKNVLEFQKVQNQINVKYKMSLPNLKEDGILGDSTRERICTID